MRVTMEWWKENGVRKTINVVLDGNPEQVEELQQIVSKELTKEGYEAQ